MLMSNLRRTNIIVNEVNLFVEEFALILDWLGLTSKCTNLFKYFIYQFTMGNMVKRLTSIVIFVLLVVSIMPLLTPAVEARTIIVDASGNGEYTTIQSAIDVASPGDIINVWSGTYNEKITLSIDDISIIGNGSSNTILDGMGDYYNVLIGKAKNFHIVGFTLLNSSVGFNIQIVENGIIEDIFIDNNRRGVMVSDSYNITFRNNIFQNIEVGIGMSDSSSNLIENNIFYALNETLNSTHSHLSYAISNSNSDNSTIRNNTIRNYIYGISCESNSNNIVGNHITENGLVSIYVRGERNHIWDNVVSNGSRGIWVGLGYNLIEFNNISSISEFGITIARANNKVIGNNINANCQEQIFLINSKSTWLSENTLTGGIHIESDRIDGWNTHTIDDSNLVNGKPIYYLKNQTSGTIPAGAGQIIIANCSDILIENQDMNNCYAGVLVFSSNNLRIKNVAISNSTYGIHLIDSDNNVISDNMLIENAYGIYLSDSNNNSINRNVFLNNNETIVDEGIGNKINEFDAWLGFPLGMVIIGGLILFLWRRP